jgi:hypothetical protein
MSRTESTMVQLGTIAPSFELVNVLTGKALSRDDVFALSANAPTAKKRGLLIMFLCVHCPYVKHIEEQLARIAHDYFDDHGPIAIAAIQSNDIDQYPEDNPDAMRAQATRLDWHFPYLLDATQQVARAYQAACTPDFFLFDADLRLVYRGQLDSSRPRRKNSGPNDRTDVPVTGKDLRAALDALIANQPPIPDQCSSIGCNIKWRDA